MTFIGEQKKYTLKRVQPIACCYWPSCRMFTLDKVIVGQFVRFTNGECAHLICQEYAQERQARANLSDISNEHKSIFNGKLR